MANGTLRGAAETVFRSAQFRLTLGVGLLAIGLAALIWGHHLAWYTWQHAAGDEYKFGSSETLRADVLLALSVVPALSLGYLGYRSAGYSWVLNILFACWTLLNLSRLLGEEFYISGRHGCAVCESSALLLLIPLPVFAALGAVVSLMGRCWWRPVGASRSWKYHAVGLGIILLAWLLLVAELMLGLG